MLWGKNRRNEKNRMGKNRIKIEKKSMISHGIHEWASQKTADAFFLAPSHFKLI
jgi:hypothetical protein